MTDLESMASAATRNPPSTFLLQPKVLHKNVVGVVTGTHEWQCISGRFMAPAGAHSVRVRLVGNGQTSQGSTWVDDLFLGEIK